jgi:hypothetical protein
MKIVRLKPTAKSVNICLISFLFIIGLKQGDILSPLFSNFALQYAIKKAHENQVGLKFNGTHQPLVYTDDYSRSKRREN